MENKNIKEKDVRIPLYVRPDVKEEIEKKAKAMGLNTINAYIRMLIMQDLNK